MSPSSGRSCTSGKSCDGLPWQSFARVIPLRSPFSSWSSFRLWWGSWWSWCSSWSREKSMLMNMIVRCNNHSGWEIHPAWNEEERQAITAAWSRVDSRALTFTEKDRYNKSKVYVEESTDYEADCKKLRQVIDEAMEELVGQVSAPLEYWTFKSDVTSHDRTTFGYGGFFFAYTSSQISLITPFSLTHSTVANQNWRSAGNLSLLWAFWRSVSGK